MAGAAGVSVSADRMACEYHRRHWLKRRRHQHHDADEQRGRWARASRGWGHCAQRLRCRRWHAVWLRSSTRWDFDYWRYARPGDKLHPWRFGDWRRRWRRNWARTSAGAASSTTARPVGQSGDGHSCTQRRRVARQRVGYWRHHDTNWASCAGQWMGAKRACRHDWRC